MLSYFLFYSIIFIIFYVILYSIKYTSIYYCVCCPIFYFIINLLVTSLSPILFIFLSFFLSLFDVSICLSVYMRGRVRRWSWRGGGGTCTKYRLRKPESESALSVKSIFRRYSPSASAVHTKHDQYWNWTFLRCGICW